MPPADTHLEKAARALAEAFHHGPATLYLVPEEAKRRRVMPGAFAAYLAYGRRYGEVHTTPEAEGAAIWLRSEDARENLWRMARTGMFLSSLRFGPAGFGRMLRYARFIRQRRAESVPESHLYLFILGICPARQGRGVDGALLERGLEWADGQGRACYLETARERNVRFYERHGFVVVWQAQVPEGGPRLWGMYRASPQ